jgi:hypothetical protein
VAGSTVTFWMYDDEEEEGEKEDPFPEPVEEEDAEPADENVGVTKYNDDDTGRGGGRGRGGRASGAGDGNGDGDDVDVLCWLGVRDWGRNFFGDSHREDETERAMISGRGGSESTAAHAWNMGSIGLYGW